MSISDFSLIDTVDVLISTGDFQNFWLLDQVKLVYPIDQQAYNLIILSHQAGQEQLDSWQIGAKKMEKISQIKVKIRHEKQ